LIEAFETPDDDADGTAVAVAAGVETLAPAVVVVVVVLVLVDAYGVGRGLAAAPVRLAANGALVRSALVISGGQNGTRSNSSARSCSPKQGQNRKEVAVSNCVRVK